LASQRFGCIGQKSALGNFCFEQAAPVEVSVAE